MYPQVCRRNQRKKEGKCEKIRKGWAIDKEVLWLASIGRALFYGVMDVPHDHNLPFQDVVIIDQSGAETIYRVLL